jgi:hypothetical protein
MSTEETIDWAGKSGAIYRYWIYPFWPTYYAKAGNYIFAKQTSPGYWLPIYIGETGDLSERFDNHHKLANAKRAGATHIHSHVNAGGAQARRDEESDLVARWNPPCNG